MKKQVTLITLGLMVVSNLPLFAQEKKSKAKKAFSCTYQLVKIGVGCGLLAALIRDFKYNPTAFEVVKAFRGCSKNLYDTINYDTVGITMDKSLAHTILENEDRTARKEAIASRFINPEWWSKATVMDLYKNVAAVTVMQLTTAGTGLGLIISGIKEIYHEYAARQSGIEKEGHSPIVVGASEKE